MALPRGTYITLIADHKSGRVAWRSRPGLLPRVQMLKESPLVSTARLAALGSAASRESTPWTVQGQMQGARTGGLAIFASAASEAAAWRPLLGALGLQTSRWAMRFPLTPHGPLYCRRFVRLAASKNHSLRFRLSVMTCPRVRGDFVVRVIVARPGK
jgi:hypothetical protein